MNKEFIPYEQALALKELGFNKPCFKAYFKYNSNKIELLSPLSNTYGEGHLFTNSDEIYSEYGDGAKCSAPLYKQAFGWFREKYDYDIQIKGTYFRASYVIGIPVEINIKAIDGYPLVLYWDYIIDETGIRKTYEEAELECLKKLIKIVK